MIGVRNGVSTGSLALVGVSTGGLVLDAVDGRVA